MKSKFPGAVPEMPVRDINEAAAYYESKLGFTVDWRGEELGLAGISKGNCRMFLANSDYRKEYGNIGPVLTWLNAECCDGGDRRERALSHTSRYAVLLHGLGRSPASMRPIERLLAARGYVVLNLGYPSRSATIPSLAARIAERIHDWQPVEPVDFVTHSLGGILLRAAVASGALSPARVHRAVMLGPPNAGSELADRLPAVPFFGWLYARMTGPAGSQLGTAATSVPAQLPAVLFETGIIAGTRSWNPVFSALLAAPNDGKVRVERTRVAGMRDFLEVPCWHPLLMTAAIVHEQVIHFLDTGQFRHP